MRSAGRAVALALLVACGDRVPATAPVLAPPAGPSALLAYAGFTTSSVNVYGNASVQNGALVLTNGKSQSSAAWAPAKQVFVKGWETSFDFRVDQVPACGINEGDGFAFVIQNMSGSQPPNGVGGEMGYKNFTNALVVEFDEYFNTSITDPNSNHLAVVSNGAGTISATVTKPIVTATPPFLIKDGKQHNARIHYEVGKLQVFLDGNVNPLIDVPVNLTNLYGADILDANGGAWVGFTSGTGTACASHQILNWSLSDNNPPVASFADASYAGDEGAPIALSASASDPDGDAILRYEWDFNNDGVTDQVTSGNQVSHAFTMAGDVTVGVVAVDAYLARSAAVTTTVHVANIAPVVTAAASLQADPGQPMSYTASFTDAGTQDGPWSYSIDWGDGSSATTGSVTSSGAQVDATHAYAAPRLDPYVVTLTVTDAAGAAGSATTSVRAGKVPATVTLGALSATYDGNAHAVSVTTDPADLAVSVTYDGASTVPVNGGSYAVVATISDARYEGSASGTLVIAPTQQSLTFDPIPDHTFGDPPFVLSAVGGGSTAPVTFTLDAASHGCTLSGATVSIVSATGNGPGCTVVAQQAGDRNFLPAASVSRTFSIARAKPGITWSPSSLVYGAPLGPSQLDATALGVSGQPLSGTFDYVPQSGTMPTAGVQTLAATFVPADADNYEGAEATASVQVSYTTSTGHQFLPPMGRTNMFNAGRTIPLKFQLYLAGGITPVSTARAHLEVYSLDTGGRTGVRLTLAAPADFVFVDGHYQLDFDTTPLGAGHFRLAAMLDDGSSISADIVLH
ncbi:MAG TPA: MBG domain-containing protein [Gemmatimonadaceae bacterium]|nr:MBG domain-containing protein [Gemmatimonadaceae bacterium]